MTRTGVRSGLLVALLAVSLLHSTHAGLSIFWRLAVLSFDSPVTQHCDELASLSVPGDDIRREAFGAVTVAASTVRGRVLRSVPAPAEAPTASPGVSRAPPSV